MVFLYSHTYRPHVLRPAIVQSQGPEYVNESIMSHRDYVPG